jgi:ADP-heptose:LPS heptosyltransferase
MAWTETFTMTLANLFPAGVDTALRTLAENKQINRLIHTYTKRKLLPINRLARVLVVSDTNIGDAVFLQSSARILKYYFPDCTVDYIYQKSAHPLIRYNPYIDHAFPHFKDMNFTSTRNSESIVNLIAKHRYDLIINLYPFFSNGALNHASCPVIIPYRFIANIVANTKAQAKEPPHVLLQLYNMIHHMLFLLPTSARPVKKKLPFPGNSLYLSNKSLVTAQALFGQLGLRKENPILFLNPDTSSQYTLIPLSLQIAIVKQLLMRHRTVQVLIGPGFTYPNVEKALRNTFSENYRDRVFFLPRSVSIDTYAVLIDRADVFITGDTAQMHVAAAYKELVGEGVPFRNRTALIGIFGATNSSIYGYDSHSRRHLAGNQNAPCFVFSGKPECKNLTCIHKTRKKCSVVNCFNGLKFQHIIQTIDDQFDA